MEESGEEPKQSKVRDLLEWQSFSRPELVYPKGTFISLGSLAFLLTIVFILFQEWFAILVTWAAYFLFYMLSRLPRTEVGHKISTQGLISMDHSYIWQELGPFWFKKAGTETVLHIAHRSILGHMAILINPADQEKIRDILAEYLPYIEVPEESAVEKLTSWFSSKLGLNK